MPADEAELVFAEAVQLLFAEAAFPDEVCEDDREDGVAEVEEAVDVFAALSEVVFQIP